MGNDIIISGSLRPSQGYTPLDARSQVDTKSDVRNISQPVEGLTIYVKDEKRLYYVTNVREDSNYNTYITEEDIKPVGTGSGSADGVNVVFSDGIEPEDVNVIWVDGQDNSPIDESTFQKIRTELNKLSNRINNIEYAFDVKLDSGDTSYYKGSELEKVPGIQPDTEYDIQLSFTYDGQVLTFKRTDNGEDLNDVTTNIVLKNEEQEVLNINWQDSKVFIDTNKKEYQIHSLNYLEFDHFILYNGSDKEYEAQISSSELSNGEPTWADRLQPNVHHICIKRAATTQNLKEYSIQEGELVYSVSENKLYIGNNGKPASIGGGSGSGNITASYIDLLAADNKTTYRITIDPEGNLIIKNQGSSSSGQEPVAGQNLGGLVIAMVYAGPEGATNQSNNICSHSYIELHNAHTSSRSLDGCSICIGTDTWKKIIPLKGEIPAKHSYLIRLNPVSNINSATCKVKINKFDLDAYALDNEIKLSSKGFKIYLCVGNSFPNMNNPYDVTNESINSNVLGYIDLVGCTNQNQGSATTVNAAEMAKSNPVVPALLSDSRGIYRNYLEDVNQTDALSLYNSGDTNNNKKDFLPFDYSSNNSPLTGLTIGDTANIYKPWCLADGAKTMYYNKTKFVADKPNMPTMSLGEKPDARTFNWISLNNRDEYLFYRRKGTTSWLSVKSEGEDNTDYKRLRITGDDKVVFTVHKAFVRSLVPGTYEWKCGLESGYTSDTYTFVVTWASLNQVNGSFMFCQISDQQGWTFNEYEPWNLSMKQIIKKHNNNIAMFPNDPTNSGGDNVEGIEFLVNTGDMTQNGLRPSEWLDYYNAAATWLPNVPQMNTVGNNDLCPGVNDAGTPGKKVAPTTFIYFYNYEYSSNEAEKALQKFNDEFMKSVYAYDYGCAHFIVLNSNNYIQEQKAWFKKHIENLNARSTQPAWRIVIVHDAPFNIMTKRPGHSQSGFACDLSTTVTTGGLRDTPMNQKDKSNLNGEDVRFTWSRLFEEADIDLVISGHKHTYSRTYPLLENTTDPDLMDTSKNKNNLQLNPWSPLYTETGRQITRGSETRNGVVYVMCQATGYKLKSNKDVPVDGIPWLAKYFPGTISGNSISVNGDQEAPTYIIWSVSPTTITMNTYQVTNVTSGKSWDCYNGGQANKTIIDKIDSNLIDSYTLNK